MRFKLKPKRFYFSLFLLFLFSLLTACGGTDSSSQSNKPKANHNTENSHCTEGQTRKGNQSCGSSGHGALEEICLDDQWQVTERCDQACDLDWRPIQYQLVHDHTYERHFSPEQKTRFELAFSKLAETFLDSLQVENANHSNNYLSYTNEYKAAVLELNPRLYYLFEDSNLYCHEESLRRYATTGIADIDLTIRLNYDTESCDSFTLASAGGYNASCQLNSYVDEDIVGVAINNAQPNPNYIDIFLCDRLADESYSSEMIQATLAHEINHGLGFTLHNMQNNFSDCQGEVLEESEVLGQKDNGYIQKLPIVKDWVQAHFNCYDDNLLPGAHLENIGGLTDHASHWEQRFFPYENMTGVLLLPTMPSGLTLSFLESSGWYKADYRHASKLHYGKNLGCDFFKNPSPSDFSNEVYCGEQQGPQCLANNLHAGSCELIAHSSIPEHLQHYGSATNAGLVASDYYMQPIPYANVDACNDVNGKRLALSFNLSPSTEQAACFNTDNGRHNIACIDYQCEQQTLRLMIGDEVLDCPTLGGDVYYAPLNTFIHCPEYLSLCGSP